MIRFATSKVFSPLIYQYEPTTSKSILSESTTSILVTLPFIAKYLELYFVSIVIVGIIYSFSLITFSFALTGVSILLIVQFSKWFTSKYNSFTFDTLISVDTPSITQ